MCSVWKRKGYTCEAKRKHVLDSDSNFGWPVLQHSCFSTLAVTRNTFIIPSDDYVVVNPSSVHFKVSSATMGLKAELQFAQNFCLFVYLLLKKALLISVVFRNLVNLSTIYYIGLVVQSHYQEYIWKLFTTLENLWLKYTLWVWILHSVTSAGIIGGWYVLVNFV